MILIEIKPNHTHTHTFLSNSLLFVFEILLYKERIESICFVAKKNARYIMNLIKV